MSTSRPLHKGLKSYLYLLPYVFNHRLQLLGVLVSLLFTSFSVLGFGKGIAYLIDKGFNNQNPDLLNKGLLVLLLIILLLAIATYCRAFFINTICEQVISNIRKDIYRHVIHLSPSFFEEQKTSDVLSRLTSDTSLVSGIIASVFSITLRNLILFIGGITMLILTSPKLAAYVLIIVPAVLIPLLMLGKRVKNLSKEAQHRTSLLGSHIEESLAGIQTVQSYNREAYECHRFGVYANDALYAERERLRIRALLVALVILCAFSAIALVLWVGGHDVLAGRMSSGKLSSFIFYAIVVASSTGALSEVIGDIQRAAGAIERIFELKLIVPHISSPLVPLWLSEPFKGTIIFDNVDFAYPANPGQLVLQDFSFTIQPGERVALVGPSGAGKSTILQLLLRFYDPLKGAVFLDEFNLNRISLHDVRGQFGIVPQDPMIFSCSAYDNIRYANPSASEGQVIEAAKAAEALDFLINLPQGIHTFVGERGVRLSGGERQRIAIARAILKNPKILLLDEATSALDAHNEYAVHKALETLMQGRTTLVIAHRLATVLKADRIIVIDQGRIEAIGNHGTLLQTSPLYAKLARLQFFESGPV